MAQGHSSKLNIYINFYFRLFALVLKQSAALISATQHAMPSEFSECGERSVLTLAPSACAAVCVIQHEADQHYHF